MASSWLPVLKYSTQCKNSSSLLPNNSSSSSFITSCFNSLNSPSSATLNPGSKPISLKLLRITNIQKLSIVVIWALCIKVACFCKCPLSGSDSSLLAIAALILSRISAAAALVKVTTRSLSTSTGVSSSLSPQTKDRIRSTSTAVFPDPAAADTRMSLFRTSMTFFCSSVQFTPIAILRSGTYFISIPAMPCSSRHSYPRRSANSTAYICKSFHTVRLLLFHFFLNPLPDLRVRKCLQPPHPISLILGVQAAYASVSTVITGRLPL